MYSPSLNPCVLEQLDNQGDGKAARPQELPQVSGG